MRLLTKIRHERAVLRSGAHCAPHTPQCSSESPKSLRKGLTMPCCAARAEYRLSANNLRECENLGAAAKELLRQQQNGKESVRSTSKEAFRRCGSLTAPKVRRCGLPQSRRSGDAACLRAEGLAVWPATEQKVWWCSLPQSGRPAFRGFSEKLNCPWCRMRRQHREAAPAERRA